jgi:hypothetical protein
VASLSGLRSFVQLGPAAQVGQIDPGFTATFTLEVQASSLSTGAYDLGLIFNYRIGTSGEFSQQRSVGINVQATGGVSGDPQVVVESAKALTRPAVVGDAFDVEVVRATPGRARRREHGPQRTTTPARPRAAASGDLEPGESVTLTPEPGARPDQPKQTGDADI